MLNYKGPFLILASSFLIFISLAGSGCRSETDVASYPPESHTIKISEVLHATGHRHAERYCRFCHGAGLAGGKQLQPSCFSCHGKNWDSSDMADEAIFAPSNHTDSHMGYMHDPGLQSPQVLCRDCHGLDLRGGAEDGTPSCFLCHGQIWPTQ